MNDAKVWDDVWEDPSNQEVWTYLSQVIFDEVIELIRKEKLVQPGQPLKMAELGCGSGRISSRLAETAHARSFLVDNSQVALKRLKGLVDAGEATGRVVGGDLFRLPIKDGSLDLVWNAGVLEHFTGKTQDRAVAEMLRVLRPGGFFISLNPYAGCILHTLGKSFVESVTTYPYGEEIPLHTLESGAKHAGQQLYGEEFSVGFIVLFVGMFKRLMIVPGMGWFAPVYRLSDRFFYSLYKYDKVARFMRKADRALARLLGGYLLATVIQKQDRPAGRPGE